MSTALISNGKWSRDRELWPCPHDWPDETLLQGGVRGVVFTRTGRYITAFFEAFPRNPDTFIRGEGETVEDAEADAWAKWQRILNCTGHEIERRNYKNGAGLCKHCDLFVAHAFPSLVEDER